ncbi:MAG: hypothetical protein NXI10_03740 [bacterium]|nr:hypothetical protein [bacterium]
MNNPEYWITRYDEVWDNFKNSEINKPTDKSPRPLIERGFVFQFDADIPDPDVLFMGINPSYSNEDETIRSTYCKEQALQHPYFKPFSEIEKEILKQYNKKFSWTHMDTLVFRETQQSYIRDTLFKSADGVQFVYQQLMISKDLLEYYNPKVLVVSNTMAKELLGKNRGENKDTGEEYGVWMGLNFEFDKELGTHRIVNSGKLDDTIVFFTSMLSGQRALDLGSRERLVWHIHKALTAG